MKEFESDILFGFDLVNGLLAEEKPLVGKLYVSNTNGIYIKYTRTFNQSEFMNSFTVSDVDSLVIYGQTVGGKKFTAYHCHKENAHTNSAYGGFSTKTENIKVGTLFFGEWLEEIDTIRIDAGKVRFSYLEHWLHRFKIDNKRVNNELESFSIELKQFSNNFNVEINDGITIKASNSWEQRVDNNKKLTFEVQQFLEYTFTNSISLQAYYEFNFKLQNFFRLILPDNNIFIEEQHITVKEKNIEIYSSDKHYTVESDKVSQNNFLYLYSEDTINDVLLKWFSSQDKYGRIFKVLSSILDNPPFMYVEHKFLNIVHWFESYCRVQYPTSKEEVAELKHQIANIIEQISGDEDKKFIENITEHTEETPLNKQLKRIFDDIKLKDILGLNSRNIDSLIHHIGNNRNRLTHTNKDSKFSYLLIGLLAEILRDIILIILIKILKLDEGKDSIKQINYKLKHHYSQYIEAKQGGS